MAEIKWQDLPAMAQAALKRPFPVTLEFVTDDYRGLEQRGLVQMVRIDHRYCQVNITDAGRDMWLQAFEAASDEPTYNPATNWIKKSDEDVRAEVEAGWQAAEDVDIDTLPLKMLKREGDSISVYREIGGAHLIVVDTYDYEKQISQQAAEIERLQKINSGLLAIVEELQADIVALTTRNRALVERAEKAEAEAEAMRQALKPFADYVQVDDADGRRFVDDWHISMSDLLFVAADALENNAGADLLARLAKAEADRDAARAALDTLRTQSLETENAMHQQLDEIHHIVFAAGKILGSADGNNLQDAVTEAFKLLDR